MTARATITTLPLVTRVEAIEDPRTGRHPRRPLRADTWVDIALLGQRKRSWRATFLDLSHGIPSYDPCGRVLAVRDAEPFAACFLL